MSSQFAADCPMMQHHQPTGQSQFALPIQFLFGVLSFLHFALCFAEGFDDTKHIVGYICYSTTKDQQMSFEWCNGTHYGGPDDIVPILDVMDCSVSWIQPPTHQNWICKTLYPPGWTCAQGLFNTDLLAFNVEDIEDCELLEVLSVIDVLSMEALDEWDYICEDMHTQDNGYVNLDPLVLDMSVNPLSTRVFYECNDPKRNPGRFSIT